MDEDSKAIKNSNCCFTDLINITVGRYCWQKDSSINLRTSGGDTHQEGGILLPKN
jgi:hypothetical protein